MSYELTLEKAGAKVLAFKEVGSYQGDWMAIVEYNSQKAAVEGSYGSCSGCDAFEGEFGYGSEVKFEDGKYIKNYDEEATEEEYNAYQQRLADFGKSYLDVLMTEFDLQNWLDNNPKSEDGYSFDEDKRELYQWGLDQLKNS
jgi:hypothetical protein